MRLPCKTKIEKAWLVTSLIILVTHRMLEASPPDYYSQANMLRLWLEVAMVLLSFPLGGLVMFVIRDATFWCDECGNLEWMLDWSTLLFVGYVQWFWVLPEIRRNNQTITLNLTSPIEIASPAPPQDDSLTLPELAPVVFNTATFVPLLAEFDEAGLTALERVLQAQAAPPRRSSHVELIAPQGQ
ncbi:MAG: hypothetical protein H0W99_14200 [Acidobacteria bacterium]|nr:hypothetical protein [Acidobacteriota bacterium]